MVQKTEDPFVARLNRLNNQEPREPRMVQTPDYLRDAQSSVLLPLAAMALLIVGGAAFSMMMIMPDPDGTSFAATTLELLSSK